MNPLLGNLNPYPFERLNDRKANLKTKSNEPHISLALGEPRHAPPPFILDALQERTRLQRGLSAYPPTRGRPELREAISQWLARRYQISTDPENEILPVNGTREGLFSFGQAVLTGSDDSLCLLPNPFYQIYEGSILLRGARPFYVPSSNRLSLDEVPNEIWAKTELIFICTPGNPTGDVLPLDDLKHLVQRAQEFDFIVASDECYSEIYFDDAYPPHGLLQAADALGIPAFRNCVCFNSLSKRSNLPGLRSGFIAGDRQIVQSYYDYRTYHGCAMPVAAQEASELAWSDENHVNANRDIYRRKFAQTAAIMESAFASNVPQGAFYYWPEIGCDDEEFTSELFVEENITVLPGSYLGREINGQNPGKNHVRIALVAEENTCTDAISRLCRFATSR